MTQENSDQPVTYPLRWPVWMSRAARKAARARAMPVAVWLRLAVQEKLERDGDQS